MTIDFHKHLLENLTTAVLLLDDKLKILYLNPATEQLLATSSSHLLNTSIDQLFSISSNDTREITGALEGLHPFIRREASLVLAHSGQAAIVDYMVTPLVDSNNTKRILIEIRPLDRLLKITREDNMINVHQATRALVRGVAHEVKNPLGGIRGAAQLLSRELTDDCLHDYTDVIINEVDRLRTLVDKMLGSHKLPTHKMVSIHEVLERVRAIIIAESGNQITITRDYDPSLPDLWADGDQLIQATLNIARNAQQALIETKDQTDPTITLRTRALRQLTMGHKRHRLSCLVEVEDNGPGIPEDLQETLFFPMVSGRPNGTGLGLSIAQSIANQHHGLIECDSTPGKTIFKLLLPLITPSDTATLEKQDAK